MSNHSESAVATAQRRQLKRGLPGSSVTPTRAVTGARRRHRPRRIAQTGVYLTLSLLVFLGLFPFVFMFLTSFKDNGQFFSHYWAPSWPLHLGNYATAWNQIEPYFVTTVIVAIGSVAASLALSTTAAFAFARYEFFGRRFFLTMVAVLLMVPGTATLVPLLVEMRNFGLLNTRVVLMLPPIAGATVLGTILIRTYVQGIPQELFDAARIDGAGGLRMYWSVMLPLSFPVLGTIALLTVINVWNDFFWPLLTVTQNDLRNIAVGLSFFQGQNVTSWGPLFAGYTLASIPLILMFVFLSKYILPGIQGGISVARKKRREV